MIDLKELMEDRSAHQPTASHLRLDQVKQKITTRRHRRIATGAVSAAVVLLLIGGYQLMPVRRAAPSPNPAATPSPTATGFPEYDSGARLVASMTAPMSDRTVSLTWTPTTLKFIYAEECTGIPPGIGVSTEWLVNGKFMVSSSGCGGSGGFEPAGWTSAGIEIGKPATITVNLTGAVLIGPTDAPTSVPNTGTVGVAIYERVPFEDYGFPARPERLKPLKANSGCPHLNGAAHVVRSDPSDSLKPMSLQVEWRDHLVYYHQTQTPGLLHIAINGIQVKTAEWWNYLAMEHGWWWDTASATGFADHPGWVQPRQGELVTITVTPEHFNGAWHFAVARQDGPGYVNCGA